MDNDCSEPGRCIAFGETGTRWSQAGRDPLHAGDAASSVGLNGSDGGGGEGKIAYFRKAHSHRTG